MDATQKLVELEALKQLKASYFYFMDTKQWDSWLALFAADVTLSWDTEVSTRGRDGGTNSFSGREAIAEHVVKGILDPATTVHQGHTPLLEILSETEARGIWAMEDIVYANSHRRSVVHGWGHYHETYRKEDGAWKITSLHLTRLLLMDSKL